MYPLNYAGVIIGREHIDLILDMAGEEGWFGNLPFYVQLPSPRQVSFSLISKSLCSKEISKMIALLVEKGISHRLFSVPFHNERVMESLTPEGELVIFSRPRDMIYQRTFITPQYVEGANQVIEIAVAGPHVHARKAYRLLSWWLREHDKVSDTILGNLMDRIGMARAYVRYGNGFWRAVSKDRHYLMSAADDIDTVCFHASVNGFTTTKIFK